MAKLTQEEKDAINDAAKAQWWKNWYEWDYSWEGLAWKYWEGWVVVEDQAAYKAYLAEHGLPNGAPNKACRVIPSDKVELLPEGTNTKEANLQDYWRDQEDILVEREGQKTYTNIHLPLEYYDGTSTWKDDPDHKKWKALTDLLTKRLESGLKTDVQIGYFGDETVRGQDRRAQFWGGVLPALPSRLEPDQANQEEVTGLNLTLVHAVITKSQNFHQTIFGSAFNAKEAQFAGGNTSFNGAHFTGGNASFNGAQFTGGYASFYAVLFTGGEALFSRAWFKISCDFKNALFENQAKLADTISHLPKVQKAPFAARNF